MLMQFNFEKLEIWKQARRLCSEIYKIIDTFPSKERFGLTDQIRRAAISVVLNIAEGSNRNSRPDFIRFLRISQGSICEVVTGLYLAFDQGYIAQTELDFLYEELVRLSSRITATIKALNNK